MTNQPGGITNETKSQSGEHGASMSPIKDGTPKVLAEDQELDDCGTSPAGAVQVLEQLRDGTLDSSNEKLAVALGRPIEEIEAWLSGAETIDADVLMKARTLAIERGVNAE